MLNLTCRLAFEKEKKPKAYSFSTFTEKVNIVVIHSYQLKSFPARSSGHSGSFFRWSKKEFQRILTWNKNKKRKIFIMSLLRNSRLFSPKDLFTDCKMNLYCLERNKEVFNTFIGRKYGNGNNSEWAEDCSVCYFKKRPGLKGLFEKLKSLKSRRA